MHELEVTCFGTADGTACGDRYHSAFLYRFDTVSLIMDCGEPLCHSLKQAGVSFHGLDRILISHLHFDHVGGFFMLVQGLWLEKRRRPLKVHLPADGLERVPRMLEGGCLCEEILPFRLDFAPLADREAFTVKQVRVTPVLNTHLNGLKRLLHRTHPLRYEAFSFLLETEHFRVGHSADIGAVSDLAPLLEKPLDLLVCEMAHVHPETVCEFLRGRDIRCLALIHFGRPQWARLRDIRKLVQRSLPDLPVLYPKDGQVIRLLSAKGGARGRAAQPCLGKGGRL
jgi:phosphoribosyl 1,2-cyclic phosphodiesterase